MLNESIHSIERYTCNSITSDQCDSNVFTMYFVHGVHNDDIPLFQLLLSLGTGSTAIVLCKAQRKSQCVAGLDHIILHSIVVEVLILLNFLLPKQFVN